MKTNYTNQNILIGEKRTLGKKLSKKLKTCELFRLDRSSNKTASTYSKNPCEVTSIMMNFLSICLVLKMSIHNLGNNWKCNGTPSKPTMADKSTKGFDKFSSLTANLTIKSTSLDRKSKVNHFCLVVYWNLFFHYMEGLGGKNTRLEISSFKNWVHKKSVNLEFWLVLVVSLAVVENISQIFAFPFLTFLVIHPVL